MHAALLVSQRFYSYVGLLQLLGSVMMSEDGCQLQSGMMKV